MHFTKVLFFVLSVCFFLLVFQVALRIQCSVAILVNMLGVRLFYVVSVFVLAFFSPSLFSLCQVAF